MKIKNMQDLLIYELRDLYSAETQIVKALPKVIQHVTSPELGQALEAHLEETKNHVTRLEEAIKRLDAGSPKGQTCKGMQGVLEEGEEAFKEAPAGELLDAAIISACQRVEHYEMAGYGSARSFAEQLGLEKVVKLLQETLDEEGAADKKLTSLSKATNRQAAAVR